MVSDTALYAEGIPTLCIGLRGLVYTEIEATGPMRDLHSGLYGGLVANAVYGLIELLAKAKSPDGRLQIPGIYDAVKEPAPAELESWKTLPFNEREFLTKEVGSPAIDGRARPHGPGACLVAATLFKVHGIAGGFTGAGAKTVIPGEGDGESELPPGSRPGS